MRNTLTTCLSRFKADDGHDDGDDDDDDGDEDGDDGDVDDDLNKGGISANGKKATVG